MLNKIFQQFGPAYLDRYKEKMLPSHRQVLKSIIACQTDSLGGSLHKCEDCGHEHYLFHSCRSRFCPVCYDQRTEQWVRQLKQETLPVPHFHFVFTLPSEFRDIVRRNQKVAYRVLMRSAFKSLQKLAKDKKYLGGRIGGVSVLHTWSRTIAFHPHVHIMVPAGAVSKDDKWIPSNPAFFVPVKALKKIFRATFVKELRKSIPKMKIDQAVWKKSWSIHVNRFDSNINNLANYLGRYIYRIAISKARLLNVTDNLVTFKGEKGKPITLSGEEFIRRYLQHVLPKGFHKTRRFGIMHASHSSTRARIKLALGKNEVETIIETTTQKATSPQAPVCRQCGSTHILISAIAPTRHTNRVPP